MHRILYKPQGRLLSSAVGEIQVAVDGDFVDVTLTATGGIVILSERYYAYGGYVMLYDLGSLIEAEMRTSGQSTGDFTLRVFTDTVNNKADSCVLHILYCDRFTVCTDIPTFLKENFLTTLSMRCVAPDTTLSLFIYAEKGESIDYSVAHTFRKKDSEALYHHSYSADVGKTADSSGVIQLNISLSSIIADAASFATAKPGDITLLSLQSVAVSGQSHASLTIRSTTAKRFTSATASTFGTGPRCRWQPPQRPTLNARLPS